MVLERKIRLFKNKNLGSGLESEKLRFIFKELDQISVKLSESSKSCVAGDCFMLIPEIISDNRFKIYSFSLFSHLSNLELGISYFNNLQFQEGFFNLPLNGQQMYAELSDGFYLKDMKQ